MRPNSFHRVSARSSRAAGAKCGVTSGKGTVGSYQRAITSERWRWLRRKRSRPQRRRPARRLVLRSGRVGSAPYGAVSSSRRPSLPSSGQAPRRVDHIHQPATHGGLPRPQRRRRTDLTDRPSAWYALGGYMRSGAAMPSRVRPWRRVRAARWHSARRLARTGGSAESTGQAS